MERHMIAEDIHFAMEGRAIVAAEDKDLADLAEVRHRVAAVDRNPVEEGIVGMVVAADMVAVEERHMVDSEGMDYVLEDIADMLEENEVVFVAGI